MRELAPQKVTAGFSEQGWFIGKRFELQFESVEIIAFEGGDQNVADLIEVGSDLEFFVGPAHGKIVDKNLALIDGALCDAAQFAELEIVQMLDAHPDTGSDYREHESPGAAGRPEEKEAEHGEYGGNGIENDDD